MSNTDKLLKRFLRTLHERKTVEVFEELNSIVEQLETKDDPELFEISVVDTALKIIENLSLLETTLKEHVNGNLTGDKLQQLYENSSTYVGTQVLFDYKKRR